MTVFIALDDKQECVGYYAEGKLVFDDQLPEYLTKTWKYHSFLSAENVEYAHLYCSGANISDVCPEHLKSEWDRVSKKMKAFIRSFKEAKVSLQDNCIFDLVPHYFLLEFFDVQTQIVEHIFATKKKPENYDFLLSAEKMITDLRSQPVKVDTSVLKDRLAEKRVRSFVQNIAKEEKKVHFNQFKSKTGRLVTEPNTFPILTMDKSFRSVVQPNNDWFVEFDYNAAELRTLLALSNQEQPDLDIHEWLRGKVKSRDISRKQVKQEVFAWLYGSTHVDGTEFADIYVTEEVKNLYWDGTMVHNCFGRHMPADEHHALSYIVQSTTSDLVLRRAIAVHEYLKHFKSSLAFIIHDSIIVDLHDSERHELLKLREMFENNDLGKFRTHVSVGKTLGTLQEIHI